jgi:hypothetical protein
MLPFNPPTEAPEQPYEKQPLTFVKRYVSNLNPRIMYGVTEDESTYIMHDGIYDWTRSDTPSHLLEKSNIVRPINDKHPAQKQLEVITTIISPERLRLLAEWITLTDKPGAGTEVQDDLKRLADAIEEASGKDLTPTAPAYGPSKVKWLKHHPDKEALYRASVYVGSYTTAPTAYLIEVHPSWTNSFAVQPLLKL